MNERRTVDGELKGRERRNQYDANVRGDQRESTRRDKRFGSVYCSMRETRRKANVSWTFRPAKGGREER